jgi:hypothetical protein
MAHIERDRATYTFELETSTLNECTVSRSLTLDTSRPIQASPVRITEPATPATPPAPAPIEAQGHAAPKS